MRNKRNNSTSKSRSAHTPLGGVVRILRGRAGPIPIILAIVGAFFFAWYAAWFGIGSWEGVRDYVLARSDYCVTQQDVQITPQPEWIQTDIRARVFRDASLEGRLSVSDPDLCQRIADALALHPWVAKVHKVTKHHPARVQVELQYRQPVCMVEGPAGRSLPVDVEGVLLPREDFSPIEASKYPRLSAIDTVPVGPEGTIWGDFRIVGGAEIAAALLADWNRLGLDRIVPSAMPEFARPEETIYELYTRAGTRIIWGRAPGTDMPGEVPAVDKIARLKRYLKENGTLEGPNGPQQFDVRSLRSIHVGPRTAGRPPKTSYE